MWSAIRKRRTTADGRCKAALRLVAAAALLLSLAPAYVAHAATTWHVPGDFATIADAVAAPTTLSGDTIQLAAGSFNTAAQIVIAKDLTITGAGAGATTITLGFDTGAAGDARGWFLVNTGVTFNLSNVTLDGSSHKAWQGIRYNGQGTVTNCALQNIQYEASGPSYAGTGIVAFGSGNVTVSNCTFLSIGRVGVLYFGSTITGSTFSGNTYTGKGSGDFLDYAVEVGAGAVVTISNNIISGDRGVASSDGSTSAGILVSTFYGAGTHATITGNYIANSTAGIAVGYDTADTSTVSGSANRLSANTDGIDAIGTGTITFTNDIIAGNTGHGAVADSGPPAAQINALSNWWGCASGPGNPSCDTITGNVITSSPLALPPTAVGCTGVPNGAPCNDGDACTTGDACSSGSCVGIPACTPTHTPLPTWTPGGAFTATPTNTKIPTRTVTSVPVNTATFTPAMTLASRTPTRTRTATAVPTNTSVPTATATALASGGCQVAPTVSLPSTTTQDTSTANANPNDPVPTCGNNSNRKAAWFKYVAGTTGSVTVDTFGSSYDTILQVFASGDGTCGTLAAVSSACNDDAGGGVQSQTKFTATSGVTYYVLVSAFNLDGGSLVFNLYTTPAAAATNTPVPTRTATSVPANTATFTPAMTLASRTPTQTRTATAVPTNTSVPAATATALTSGGCQVAPTISLPSTTAQNTSTANANPSDPVPTCSNNSNRKAAWFKYVAGSSGSVTVDTFGSSYDTILQVFTSADGTCGTLTATSGACNDDAGGGVQSQTKFTATSGVTYYVLASAFNLDGGSLVLNLYTTPAAAATNTPVPTRTVTSVPANTATFTPAMTLASRTPTPTRTQPPTATNTATPTVTPTALPPNGCLNATDLTSMLLPYLSGPIDTTVAVTNPGNPAPTCGNGSIRNAVWFKYTTLGGGMSLTVNTFGSNYDTILSVYKDSTNLNCTTAGAVTCNDDSSGTVQSSVSFTDPVGNTDYYFMVSSFSPGGGTLYLKITSP